MNRLAIPLSILALTSAGCAMSVREPNIIPPSPAIQPQTTGFRTGTGVVQSVAVAPARMGAAAAGASASTNRPGPLAEAVDASPNVAASTAASAIVSTRPLPTR